MEKDFEVYQGTLGYTMEFTGIGTLLLTDSLTLALYTQGSTKDNPLITITGVVNVLLQKVTFDIPDINIVSPILLEHLLFKDYGVYDTVLSWGTLTVKELPLSVDSIQDFINAELPSGVTLTPEFTNTKIRYWELYLKDSFEPPIISPYLEANWPTLGKALIGKLVVYDSLKVGINGELSIFMGGGGNVKKITTGPSDAEFFDITSSLNNLFKPTGKGNRTPFQMLAMDICELSGKLGIHLSMCEQIDIGPIPVILAKIPRRTYNPNNWPFYNN